MTYGRWDACRPTKAYRRVRAALSADAWRTTRELADAAGVSVRTARAACIAMGALRRGGGHGVPVAVPDDAGDGA